MSERGTGDAALDGAIHRLQAARARSAVVIEQTRAIHERVFVLRDRLAQERERSNAIIRELRGSSVLIHPASTRRSR